jgi:signal transduction histidine kinase
VSFRPAEVVALRRFIALFIALVVVPVLGLVGFGVLAISNERAAVEKRFADEYAGRLRALAEHLAARIADTTARLEQAGIDGHEGDPLVRFTLRLDEAGLATRPAMEPALAPALGATLRSVEPSSDGSATLVPVNRGVARGLYAVRRSATGLEGLAFSEAALADTVEAEGARRFPSARARFALEPPREHVGGAGAVRRVLEDLTSDRNGAGFGSLPLPAPLADWRLVASLRGDDPVRSALIRNRTVYVVLLALFYLAITAGVIFTFRSILEESQLSRLKTDFVSNISHELRTPLTSIRMFAETLQQGRVSTEEERAACLDFIVTESERLAGLTERALEWARMESGRRTFELERHPVRAVVAAAVDRFRQHRAMGPGELDVSWGEELPEVVVDRAALEQVLLNLLENAVKYSPADKRIRVRVERRGRWVAIDVADHGIGIARSDLRRIFERFYRADDLLARRIEGSGLGLSIAKRIVDGHHGRVRVHSEVGRGSVFTVELPVAKPAANSASLAEKGVA